MTTSIETPEQNGLSDTRRSTLDRLLEDPNQLVSALLEDGRVNRRRLAIIALAALGGIAFYGAGMGSFQGGVQILRSMVKAPLVLFASLLLAFPSLYVFTGLAAGGTSLRRVLVTATTYAALLAAVLVALLPISWLFSAATNHLWFVTEIHFLSWCLALLLGHRVLQSAVSRERRGHGLSVALLLWSGLLLLVSLQMATHLRPILWQEADGPFVEQEKRFFLEHFTDQFDATDSPKSTGSYPR